ncbi:MAG: hypothetical protein OEZ36_02740 [Spirochaetota bacterium]|nr:hypothetical protein [Spirochaetota bacterium]
MKNKSKRKVRTGKIHELLNKNPLISEKQGGKNQAKMPVHNGNLDIKRVFDIQKVLLYPEKLSDSLVHFKSVMWTRVTNDWKLIIL